MDTVQGGRGMGNYKFLFLVIIVLLLVPIFSFGQNKMEGKDILMDILMEMDGDFVENYVDMGGVIIEDFIPEEELLLIGHEVRERLGIRGHENLDEYYFEELIEEDGFIQLLVQGVDKEEKFITFSLTSYEYEKDNLRETSLFVNVKNKSQIIEINDIILEIEKIFEGYNKPINITKCVIGLFDGDMDLEAVDSKLLNTTKTIRGKLVEEYKEDGVLSYSLYTPYINEYIYTGSERMNLNIGIRYNEYEDKNYILIGTPIISIGY